MKLLKKKLIEPSFGNLPTELLVEIFKFLPISDRNAASYTCWKWYEASKYLGFAKQMCLHLIGVEFDDSKPPIADLLLSPHVFPVLKLTRVRLQQSVYSQFWADFGPSISEITFEKCMVWRERIISVFKHMKNLRTARFVECDLLRDDLFKNWKFFENGLLNIHFLSVTSLSLAKNNFTELQFSAIVEMMPNLTEVDLSNCFSYIDSASKAQMLNCVSTFILERQFLLKCLNLSGIAVDDLFLRKMIEAHQLFLESLSLTYLEKMPLRNPAIVSLLRQQTEMRTLDLSQSVGITDYCLDQIVKHMTKLTNLNLSGCWGVGDYGVTQIFRLKDLEKLDLSKCRITKKGILEGAALCNRKIMKEFLLEQIDTLDDDCIVKIGANFTNLTVLNIGGSSSCMTDWSAQYIFCNLTCLVDMNVERSTKITDAGFTGIDLPQKTFAIWDIEETFSIDRLKKLRILKVSGCYKITDFSLRYAFRFMELKELSISRCPQISKPGIEKLVTSCPALEFLDLSECPNINDYCVELIAMHLKRLSTLKLTNCVLVTEVGLGFLSQHCQNLKYLYVRGCFKLPSDIMERLSNITTLRQVYKS
ncbi:F-box/LRR-repeat protein 7-like isoform X3 [Topomyia yanbarensis]|uniref:F-box/LRR-repeat protein 7-like isoform X3 n=1 Tax=Topomyia yanbarensis TaxID=2498891 RepID=UPI00273CD7CF|nr:F-box/LRR-repeat protein 7-like isoform X3 [Topomyia yanbarensis]